MNTDATPRDQVATNRDTQAIWDRNADWWDETTGEGSQFQRVLIGPATERLLDLRPDDVVLDIACGNGAFSRRMAQLGAKVVALDFSDRMIEKAEERTKEHHDQIEYLVVDATDEARLLGLGTRRFTAAVCTMGLMDMTTIEPLMTALPKLLQPSGRFVFSVLHPCFNSSDGLTLVSEEEYRDGALQTIHSVKVSKYIRSTTFTGLAIQGQPLAHYYFHRPLSVLLGTCFDAGFVLDGLEEPVFDEAAEATTPHAWANAREIPPVLVARLRLA